MGYLSHLRSCNAHDLRNFRRFIVDGRSVGWVRHGLAARLAEERSVFSVTEDAVYLSPSLTDPEDRSRAVAEILPRLVEEGVIDRLRGEQYAVLPRWGEPPLMKLDRAAVPYFGIRSYGVHVNGYVRRADGLHLWIGRRNADRHVAPGKLDNLVAGGLPYGLTIEEDLVKEAGEEADIGRDLALTAVPVGAVTYVMEQEQGLKPDTLFVYDLELDEAFRPRNTDGEVAGFTLMPLEEVARLVRETDEFKFNVNLVILDFLIRHGRIRPDDPEYPDLVTGLHAPLPE